MAGRENTSDASALQVAIARDILGHLFRQAAKLGAHLAVQDLADQFGVSRTPVRSGLQLLQDHGFVDYERNRGFFLAKPISEHDAARLLLPSSQDLKLQTQIIEDWQSGHIGDVFSELEIRRRYDLGRLSASRILVELADKGVISRKRGHGWEFEVAISSKSDFDESYDFRAAVETGAVLCPSFRYDPTLADLCRLHHHELLAGGELLEENRAQIFECDAEFHHMIGMSSHNRFFQNAIERQNTLRKVVEYGSRFDARKLRKSCEEHLRITDLLEAGDLVQAAQELRLHLEGGRIGGPAYPDSAKTASGRDSR